VVCLLKLNQKTIMVACRTALTRE